MWISGAAVAEWLSSWLAEQEDRGSIPSLATWIFRYWLSPASKSRYGWKIAKSTLILKTTNQPLCGFLITHAFFAETFQPMNAALTFQIGLNACAQAIRRKFKFAGAWQSFQRIRTDVIPYDKTSLIVPWFLTLWPWLWSLTYFWKTLTLAITFKSEVIGLSYCTYVFLVTRPFTWYHNFFTLWPWPWSLTYFWKTLSLAITFKPEVTGLSYFTCVFLVTRPFT